MPVSVPTTPQAIFAALKVMIQTQQPWQDSNCFLSQNPDALFAPGDVQLCVITQDHFEPDQGMVFGGGRFDVEQFLYVRGGFTVTIWGQVFLDEKQRDDIMLTDPSLSINVNSRNLIALLQMATLVDASGNLLTPEPIRLKRITSPVRRQEDGWCRLKQEYEMPFQLSLGA